MTGVFIQPIDKLEAYPTLIQLPLASAVGARDNCDMQGNSVTTWLQILKTGDEQAAQPLFERYFSRLVELARERLRGMPTAARDEEDVALSAFHTFCEAASHNRFPKLDNRDDLWKLLVTITARAAVNQRRAELAAKRGGALDRVDMLLDEVIGPEPDPQFAAAVADEFRKLMADLGADDLRAVAQAKLEGFTNEEIASRLGISLRSVERKLMLIRGLWEDKIESRQQT